MSNNRTPLRVAAALAAASLACATMAPVAAADRGQGTMVAAADCYAVGQQVAAQNGGTLARAQASSQGGQQVCVIVVLIPGKDGQRPRRAEFVVPAG